MKNFIYLFILFPIITIAQVGINTNNPLSQLDVQGSITLRKKLFVELENNKISAGTNDQILVSQGEGHPPIWKSLSVPTFESNDLNLLYNDSFTDKKGISLPSSSNSKTINKSGVLFTRGTNIDQLISKYKFQELNQLNQEFTVRTKNSKVYVQMETIVSTNFSSSSSTNNYERYVEYGCGLFIDNKLISFRQNKINQLSNNSWPFQTHNQIGIVKDLPQGKHTIRVACGRLGQVINKKTSSGTDLKIGINAKENVSKFSAQSSLKIDVFEEPNTIKPII